MEKALRERKRDEAEKLIESNIELYENLIRDKTEYKNDCRKVKYLTKEEISIERKSFKELFEKIILKEDNINILKCGKKLIKYPAY